METKKAKTNRAEERFRFFRRYQKPNEAISSYGEALERLSQHCEFNDYLDEALCDQFVVGIISDRTRTKLLAQNDLTFQKAIDIAQGMEEAEGKEVENIKKNNDFLQTLEDVANTKCWRCNRKGHSPNVCSFKAILCSLCNRKGHSKVACPTGNSKKGKKGVALEGGEWPPNKARTKKGLLEDSLNKMPVLPPVRVSPSIDDIEAIMEFDFGASVSIVTMDRLKRLPDIKGRSADESEGKLDKATMFILGVVIDQDFYCHYKHMVWYKVFSSEDVTIRPSETAGNVCIESKF
ncbi:uncharacterized protein [Palaemon carinicauda]|uniref:uncharacterized protein n=1 Tax=Palaemon carinicauda TaxID=392227 RepID=UPI0035B65A89